MRFLTVCKYNLNNMDHLKLFCKIILLIFLSAFLLTSVTTSITRQLDALPCKEGYLFINGKCLKVLRPRRAASVMDDTRDRASCPEGYIFFKGQCKQLRKRDY